LLAEEAQMAVKYKFRFFATVSDRGQIFIPKALQNYFQIKRRDKVSFMVDDDGKVVFQKKKGGE
jgi:bifunctional DNA-binding transcriptional regulator/antitoxin component of YhaV-PrlF toxin-antitoxin module